MNPRTRRLRRQKRKARQLALKAARIEAWVRSFDVELPFWIQWSSRDQPTLRAVHSR